MTRIDRHRPPRVPAPADFEAESPRATAPEEPAPRAKRRDVENELQNRVLELEARNERLQQAQRLRHELVANMAHELHAPINAVIGFAELLREEQAGPLEARQKEFIGNIASSGRSLLAMINDILDLARLQAGMIDFRPALVDMKDLLHAAVRPLLGAVKAKRLKIESTVDPALRENVVVDAGRLRRALRAFLSVAIKFTPEGGKIAVRALVETEASLRLEVEDLGAGVERSVLRDLFAARRPEARSGEVELCLALTRALVEAQGGRIEICSAMGEGSIFSAVLPRRPARKPGD
jgi:signal transduction histidine kinase